MQLEYKSAKHFYFSFLSFTIHEISNNFERYEYLVKRFDKMIRKNEKQKRFRILCILILSLLILTNSKSFLYAETSSFWTTPEVVSTESTAHSSSPSITADSLGNVYVGWVDYSLYAGSGGDMDIFYKYWNSTTSAWTTTEVVSTESTSVSTNPSIAVDSARNVHISWEDTTVYGVSGFDSDIFYKYWNASSSMWTMTEIVSTESTDSSKRPSIAVDSAANIHVVWNDRTDYAECGVDEDIFYKCWNSTTSTWTMTEVVSNDSTSVSSFPSIAVDSAANIHVVWNDQTNYTGSGVDYDIFYKCWNSTTSLWTTLEVVSTESSDKSWLPTIAVDILNNVHVAWTDYTNFAYCGYDQDIFYKCWNTSTSSWTTTEVVSTQSSFTSWSQKIAVDSVGNVHIAWQDETNYAGCGVDEDIFYKCWNTTTSSWTITEVLSPESSKNCYGPSLCVDSLDKVHISWCDETNYLGSGNDWDIIYRRSSEFPIVTELTTKLPLIHSFILISTLIIVLFGNVLKASKIRRRRP